MPAPPSPTSSDRISEEEYDGGMGSRINGAGGSTPTDPANWPLEPPTEVGWYWVLRPDEDARRVVEVWFIPEEPIDEECGGGTVPATFAAGDSRADTMHVVIGPDDEPLLLTTYGWRWRPGRRALTRLLHLPPSLAPWRWAPWNRRRRCSSCCCGCCGSSPDRRGCASCAALAQS